MNKLYEVLEMCLKEIEQGTDVDTVLFRHPEFAEELHPILEASVKAKEMAVPVPSQEVVRRNRAKLLQRASEMRERKAAPVSRRVWSVPLRRSLVSLMVIAMLFVSGTGLVSASSATLPGDNLYPVKRTWEDILLLFTFNTTKREALELEHETERLDEVQELFAEGRSAEVDFAGYVTLQNGTEWRVSGITVSVSPQTEMPNQQVVVGDAVRVHGHIQNGAVAAMRIELLPAGSKLPEGNENESEPEDEHHEDDTGTGSVADATIPPALVPTLVPTLDTSIYELEFEDDKLEGVVTSVQNNLIVVDGIVMDIRSAEEINGTPSVGAKIKAEGYYDSSGVFIVTKIEFESSSTIIQTVDDKNDDKSSNTNISNSNDDDSHDDDDSNDDNSND